MRCMNCDKSFSFNQLLHNYFCSRGIYDKEFPLEDVFKWGIQKGVGRTNKNIHFYESFIYHGVEYFLYDSVYFYNVDDVETYIGKLVKIFEMPNHEKKVKVVWYFRLIEIRKFLGDYEPWWNELFSAGGEGKGLSSFNPLESIIQKCNVVCASLDKRNPQASEEELRMAAYVFYHSFDVGERRILKKFVDHVAGIKVEYFFNKWKDRKVITPISNLNIKVDGHTAKERKPGGSLVVRASLGVQKHISEENAMLRPKNPIDTDLTSPSNIASSQANDKANKMRFCWESFAPKASCDRKRKLLPVEKAAVVPEKVGPQVVSGSQTVSKIATKPNADKRNWFNNNRLPWLERLQRAEEAGTLVLLENLDPSLASSEVEDLVWQAFNCNVEAKMMPQSAFSCPHYGKALVIFESKVAADSAISKLQGRCLIMEDGKTVVGRKGSLKDPGKPVSFTGHLFVHKLRKRQSEEMRKAVSTSHSSQPDTFECEMAIEWRILQEASDIWWKELHMWQAKEIEDVKSQIEMNYK